MNHRPSNPLTKLELVNVEPSMIPSPTNPFSPWPYGLYMFPPVFKPQHALPSPTEDDHSRNRLQPEEKTFPCSQTSCNKVFTQVAHLKIHQRRHSGERPYACSFPGCDKSFTQLGNLKTHERKHTGEKPYKCSYSGCDKTFSQMGNMKTHELLHSGLKPFTCDIDGCRRSFTQLGNLKSHQQKLHFNPPQKRWKEYSPSETVENDESSTEAELLLKLKAVIHKNLDNNQFDNSSNVSDHTKTNSE